MKRKDFDYSIILYIKYMIDSSIIYIIYYLLLVKIFTILYKNSRAKILSLQKQKNTYKTRVRPIKIG